MKQSPPARMTTNQVAERFHISIRQLQWWDERKLIKPRHVGHRRIYYDHDTRLIAVISSLRKAHFSLQMVRRLLQNKFYITRLIENPFSIVVRDCCGIFHVRESWQEFEMLIRKYSQGITVAVVKHE